jgi:hypothetical protein
MAGTKQQALAKRWQLNARWQHCHQQGQASEQAHSGQNVGVAAQAPRGCRWWGTPSGLPRRRLQKKVHAGLDKSVVASGIRTTDLRSGSSCVQHQQGQASPSEQAAQANLWVGAASCTKKRALRDWVWGRTRKRVTTCVTCVFSEQVAFRLVLSPLPRSYSTHHDEGTYLPLLPLEAASAVWMALLYYRSPTSKR